MGHYRGPLSPSYVCVCGGGGEGDGERGGPGRVSGANGNVKVTKILFIL